MASLTVFTVKSRHPLRREKELAERFFSGWIKVSEIRHVTNQESPQITSSPLKLQTLSLVALTNIWTGPLVTWEYCRPPKRIEVNPPNFFFFFLRKISPELTTANLLFAEEHWP